MKNGISAYQEGDFVKDDWGNVVGFRGPIYNIEYPNSCDPMQDSECFWARCFK